MKIIVCPDSFKGSLSAVEAADAIVKGILFAKKSQTKFQKINIAKIPLADGGEGTTIALVNATKGKTIKVKVLDPLLREITSFYGISGDGKTAIMEMAAASGLPLLKESEHNPLITSTYGTGQLILAALKTRVKKFVIGIGGSATNDGGAGAMSALGARFLDRNGRELPPGGAALARLARIDMSGFKYPADNIKIEVACDINNPLCGRLGASAVYGPQKEATPAMVKELDAALKNYAGVVKKDLGKDIAGKPGTGAAGGLGFALAAFLNARLRSGIDMVLDAADFEKNIADADLIITGEGRIDKQTAYGKTIGGVIKRAGKYHVPVIALAGSYKGSLAALKKTGLTEVFSILNNSMTLEYAMQHAYELLVQLAEKVSESKFA